MDPSREKVEVKNVFPALTSFIPCSNFYFLLSMSNSGRIFPPLPPHQFETNGIDHVSENCTEIGAQMPGSFTEGARGSAWMRGGRGGGSGGWGRGGLVLTL